MYCLLTRHLKTTPILLCGPFCIFKVAEKVSRKHWLYFFEISTQFSSLLESSNPLFLGSWSPEAAGTGSWGFTGPKLWGNPAVKGIGVWWITRCPGSHTHFPTVTTLVPEPCSTFESFWTWRCTIVSWLFVFFATPPGEVLKAGHCSCC